MYTSSITPAMVSVAMSRSDSRDSNISSASSFGFTSAPQTVSYSSSPVASMSRTTSNTSSSSYISIRRASQTTQRRDSSANWIPSPYRSCQQVVDEPTSLLSDDDLLWIAPSKNQPLPVNTIPSLEVSRRHEMTTEEQITMLREQQEKEQENELVRQQQQRRQAAAAQKAVRFAPDGKRRTSSLKKKTGTVVRRI